VVSGQGGGPGGGAAGSRRGAGARRRARRRHPFARNHASGYLLGPSAAAAATGAGNATATIQITVTGHVPTFVPGLVINISQAVQAPVEKFVAP